MHKVFTFLLTSVMQRTKKLFLTFSTLPSNVWYMLRAEDEYHSVLW